MNIPQEVIRVLTQGFDEKHIKYVDPVKIEGIVVKRYQKNQVVNFAELIQESYSSEMKDRLRKAIRLLPENQKVVISLLLKNRTEKEIAKKLKITVQAVNKRKHNSIKSLKILILEKY